MAEDKQKQVQEKVLVYQILQNQLEEFNKQATVLETRMDELEVTKIALQETKGVRADSETLFHLGSGCYGHGRLSDNNKFLVEIGAGIMANKSLPEAVAVIESRKREIESVGKKLQHEMEVIASSINQVTADLQRLSAEAGGPGKEDRDDDSISVE